MFGLRVWGLGTPWPVRPCVDEELNSDTEADTSRDRAWITKSAVYAGSEGPKAVSPST